MEVCPRRGGTTMQFVFPIPSKTSGGPGSFLFMNNASWLFARHLVCLDRRPPLIARAVSGPDAKDARCNLLSSFS
jgi:hypothetical protein